MMRKFGYALMTGVFLLMLSTLVVSSEEMVPQQPPPLPQNIRVLAAPLSSVLPDLYTPEENLQLRKAPAVWNSNAQVLVCMPQALDSNGRVLTAVRYENSFYQVFRPEVAGG